MSPGRSRGRAPGRPTRDGRGVATVLVVGLMAVLLVLGGLAIVVGGYAVAVHQARLAADLAALSGASAFASGRDACGQASRTARANGARLEHCEQVGDLVGFVVTVRVTVEVPSARAGLPQQVRAQAHAGSA